ncbi:NAD(P)/FAD-dependent oxidoreductase [Paraburkholderia tagetis]|uniref:FAD-dependent oxidoreductase n=1 Tax=Paraburkholderia tagetis TaxID=2913261 RepID=A0A9X1RKY0_9BURK|nr:FAD-dependent oxidoreductase [Paraburkholderia tagetis]MCG5074146.1 FAD-dependent oxidoreductase [Paraburkholderia tagetis]
MSGRVVIVGSGQAGVSAAFKLRALGYQGHIALVGEEPGLPYQRPPLSKKYLTDEADVERLHIKARALYESERIELRADSHVRSIDRDGKQILLADGQSLRYDHLVLATGATPRCLPFEQGGNAPNVHTFRTLADAERLRTGMKPGASLLVVGGGYIGLETAAVARRLGMEVTLVERDTRILGRVASAETAARFRALHLANGVRICEGVELKRLAHADRNGKTAWLANGIAIDADVVVVGIGVIAQTGLAEQAGLHIDNGIVVDCGGRTSDPFIYAAGDCARFPYRGQQIRLESIQNAVDMAETVARSIVGGSAEYRPVPWFWSDQYSTRLQIAGLNLGYTHVVVRNTSETACSIWYYDGPRFIAVDAINDAKAFMSARQWLSAGRSPAADAIADPGVALNAVPLSNIH